jgi:hypothetical protein
VGQPSPCSPDAGVLPSEQHPYSVSCAIKIEGNYKIAYRERQPTGNCNVKTRECPLGVVGLRTNTRQSNNLIPFNSFKGCLNHLPTALVYFTDASRTARTKRRSFSDEEYYTRGSLIPFFILKSQTVQRFEILKSSE